MKAYTFKILSALMLILFYSCSDTIWDDLPSQVSDFISRYYPGQTISSEEWRGDVYHVKMKSGETMAFDKNLSWLSINGYGATLPQMFLFDELPPALYEYLQSTESLASVYRVERDSHEYLVELLNSTVIYNIKNGSITVPVNGIQLARLIE